MVCDLLMAVGRGRTESWRPWSLTKEIKSVLSFRGSALNLTWPFLEIWRSFYFMNNRMKNIQTQLLYPVLNPSIVNAVYSLSTALCYRALRPKALYRPGQTCTHLYTAVHSQWTWKKAALHSTKPSPKAEWRRFWAPLELNHELKHFGFHSSAFGLIPTKQLFLC